MFNIIIKRSLPVYGMYKSCNKCKYYLHKSIYLDLQFVFGHRRCINILHPLRCSQKDLKTKENENINIGNSNENDNKIGKISKEENIEKKIEIVYGEKTSDEQKKSYHSEKKWGKFDEKEREFRRPNKLMMYEFENIKNKNKETYLECLRMYKNVIGKKIERVPFIYASLRYMEEFGVQEDLKVYKELLDIFPKQIMIPTNVFQTMFMHYPKDQQCAVDLLEQMENNGVIPDSEMELMLLNIFGRHGIPTEKFWRMMYWMPKFKNLNPWPVPKPLPNDSLELAKLALVKMSSIDVLSTITVFDTKDVKDSVDKTWVVSAMSPIQSELLLKHNKKEPLYVEGPFFVYVAKQSVDYFILQANPIKNRKFPEYDTDAVDKIRNPYLETKTVEIILAPTVHEQEDGTIFALCATGTSSKDSLLSWIRLLQNQNPVLAEIPIVFTLKNYSKEMVYLESNKDKKEPSSESRKNEDKLLK